MNVQHIYDILYMKGVISTGADLRTRRKRYDGNASTESGLKLARTEDKTHERPERTPLLTVAQTTSLGTILLLVLFEYLLQITPLCDQDNVFATRNLRCVHIICSLKKTPTLIDLLSRHIILNDNS